MAFYVYFASATGKTRIHLGSCPHCRDGRAADKENQGGWTQAFRTLSEAEGYVSRMFPWFKDKKKCHHCLTGRA
ncbi:hypothetical protein [Taklimakanibacter lacteus]|uniref:hypothetical protein n=1 Tax=Taklimakanibacter lacteus TaxID=2268456 RepID=UPI000E667536